MIEDPWKGKPANSLGMVRNGGKCDDCGAETVDRCWLCGAPQCCYECCIKDLQEQIKQHNERVLRLYKP